MEAELLTAAPIAPPPEGPRSERRDNDVPQTRRSRPREEREDADGMDPSSLPPSVSTPAPEELDSGRAPRRSATGRGDGHEPSRSAHRACGRIPEARAGIPERAEVSRALTTRSHPRLSTSRSSLDETSPCSPPVGSSASSGKPDECGEGGNTVGVDQEEHVIAGGRQIGSGWRLHVQPADTLLER